MQARPFANDPNTQSLSKLAQSLSMGHTALMSFQRSAVAGLITALERRPLLLQVLARSPATGVDSVTPVGGRGIKTQ